MTLLLLRQIKMCKVPMCYTLINLFCLLAHFALTKELSSFGGCKINKGYRSFGWGRGPSTVTQGAIAESKIENVALLGEVTDTEKFKLMSQSRAVILPSNQRSKRLAWSSLKLL